ncbi:DUF4258 domain-containing protein [Candidatus Micrarchaeota archaeon]|nr:DUF4258 domain-containing protein [Candidatus Micrarchaeota archaeon]
MQKGEYEVEFSGHAVFRAESRNVPSDVIEYVIQTGTFHRFGKDMVKIRKPWGGRVITCVGQIKDQRIRIITITCRKANP